MCSDFLTILIFHMQQLKQEIANMIEKIEHIEVSQRFLTKLILFSITCNRRINIFYASVSEVI